MKKSLLICAFLSVAYIIYGQELNCRVSVVVTAQNKLNDQSVYKKMETSIRDFLNQRKWTTDKFKPHEKIECNILINITNELSSESFEATATIKSSRPVYKSSYNTAVLYHVDNDFTFSFNEFDVFEFNETVHSSNLISMLAFYAYIIIGMDYDCYAKKGGDPYFAKAQTIVNNAQSAQEKGWKSIESTRNRYWLIENLRNVQYVQIRNAMYQYHRLGLDMMYSDLDEGRKVITECLNLLLNVYNNKPATMLMQLFFNAKWNELGDIYAKAPSTEKKTTLKILSRIDASRASKYENKLNQ